MYKAGSKHHGFTHHDYVEIVDSHVDKAFGLRRLASSTNRRPTDFVAVSDAGNDIPLMKEAGLAIAMGNASPSVRSQARYSVESNDAGGVRSVLAAIGRAKRAWSEPGAKRPVV